MDQRFRWSDRLHRKSDFTTVFKLGQRYSVSGLTLWVYRPSQETQQGPRLGLAIPSTYGHAVARNRLKRLIREIFRLHKELLPRGVDLVFSARTLIPQLRYQTLELVVKNLWHKAKLVDFPS